MVQFPGAIVHGDLPWPMRFWATLRRDPPKGAPASSTKDAHPQPARLLYEWGPFQIDTTWRDLVPRWMATLLAAWLTICAGTWVAVAVGALIDHDLHTELKQRPKGFLTLLHQSVRQHLDSVVTVHWGQLAVRDVLNGPDRRLVLWPAPEIVEIVQPSTNKKAKTVKPSARKVVFGPLTYARFTEAVCFRKPQLNEGPRTDPLVRYQQAWLPALEQMHPEERALRLGYAELEATMRQQRENGPAPLQGWTEPTRPDRCSGTVCQ